ncbi:MAG: hypothetical protein CVV42_01315 [Candidatus Riflebacteria bacterium HGW-Riflebacteria-2]|jgi:tetratricopeptide (TPR) repeat protein|nr:MAG: hypothetical protein CVV42_01315 [Candidatus Riflebacteria bacterium HGW-Riflebacteria-2]
MNRLKIKTVILLILLTMLVSISAFAISDEARELNRKGELAINSGHHQEAVQHLKQAMQLEPEWAAPYFNAAKLMRLRNNREEMTKATRKAVALEPTNATYVEAYVRILKEDLQAAEKAGSKHDIKRLRDETMRVDPGNLEIGLKVLREIYKDGNLDQAADMAESLLEKNATRRTDYASENMGELFYILGNIALQRNNLNDARGFADNASKYSMANPDSSKQLIAKVKEKQEAAVSLLLSQAKEQADSGDTEGAITTLKRADEIIPNNEQVQQEITRLTSSRDAKTALAEARQRVKAGSWLEARDMLEYVVSVEPGNSEAQNLLKQAAEKEDTLMKTLARPGRLPRYSEDRAGMVEGYLRRGKQFLEAGNQKDAMISFSRGMAILELDSGLKRFIPQFEVEMNKIKATDDKKELWNKGVEARNAYEYEDTLKYLSQLPRNYDVQLPSMLAEAYWKTGNEEKALELARYQLTIQPENNRAKFIIGSISLENNDKEAAFNYFTEIYNSDPDYPELKDKLLQSSAAKWKTVFPILILLILAWIAYALYKYLPEYNKNSSLRKAQRFLKKEMHDECISELVKIKRLPNLTQFDGALISRILAQAYLKKGIYDRAIGECKHLISISPKDEEAHNWLGYAYLGRRMLSPESLPELLNLYQKDPRNIALVSLLGSHYTQSKNLSDDGIKILEQWLNLDPNNPEVLKPLGRYYLKKGRSDDKAMKVFQKMMEFGSPEAEFLLGVAKINLKLRQFDSCLQLCEQVINSDVNNELVHSVLREAYHKQNRLNELLDIYGNFLQNNPYNVAFQNGLRDAQKLAGQNTSHSQSPSAADNTPELAQDQVICPNCQHINSSQEYCCQNCGHNLA